MTDDWTDVLAALLAAEARFLVVGAHALAVHGVPRAAQDLDVWVEPSPENAEIKASCLFGVCSLRDVMRRRLRPFDELLQL